MGYDPVLVGFPSWRALVDWDGGDPPDMGGSSQPSGRIPLSSCLVTRPGSCATLEDNFYVRACRRATHEDNFYVSFEKIVFGPGERFTISGTIFHTLWVTLL